MTKYSKAIIAVGTAVAIAISTIVSPDTTTGKIVTVVLAALGAAAVYWVPNKPAA
jgi:hypothetical protein